MQNKPAMMTKIPGKMLQTITDAQNLIATTTMKMPRNKVRQPTMMSAIPNEEKQNLKHDFWFCYVKTDLYPVLSNH